MATKKQKRLAGEAKQERLYAESIAAGLKAQREDHERRKKQRNDGK